MPRKRKETSPESEGKIFLTKEELLKFNLLEEKQKRISTQIQVHQLAIKNNHLEIELMKHAVQAEVAKVSQLQDELSRSKKQAADHRAAVKEAYSIKDDSIGYNEDTGELVVG